MTRTNPDYLKLRDVAREYGEKYSFAHTINELSGEDYGQGILDSLWPQIVELLAKIKEYEHALGHCASDHAYEIAHDGDTPCSDCVRLAQSALDGANRDDCREMVDE